MKIFPPDGFDPRYWPLDGTDAKWTRWFAWYPVIIDAYKESEIKNGKLFYKVWLRWVECRIAPDGDVESGNDSTHMQFRLPQ